MEKDPQRVARLAADREEENWRFRTYLRVAGLSSARVDGLAAGFARAAEAEMDCTACGACCRDNCVPVSDEEQTALARRLGLPLDAFRLQFLTVSDDGDPALDARPCPFLDANLCSVYEDRPAACRGYPYTGGNVSSAMVGIIERAATCPIVFDMLERLKKALGFQHLR